MVCLQDGLATKNPVAVAGRPHLWRRANVPQEVWGGHLLQPGEALQGTKVNCYRVHSFGRQLKACALESICSKYHNEGDVEAHALMESPRYTASLRKCVAAVILEKSAYFCPLVPKLTEYATSDFYGGKQCETMDHGPSLSWNGGRGGRAALHFAC